MADESIVSICVRRRQVDGHIGGEGGGECSPADIADY